MSSFTSLFKFLKLPLAIASGLLALELGIRILEFGPASLVEISRFDPQALFGSELIEEVPNKRLGYKLKPNLESFYKGKSFTTNSHGFRDRPRDVIKKSGVTRIAVLGRSSEMGTALSNSEAWPGKLEKQIGEKTEVLNFSVEAYTMVQIEATYHRYAKNFKPDWVIIPIYYEEIETVVPINAPRLPSELKRVTSLRSFMDHFYFPRWIQFTLWNFTHKYISPDWEYLYRPEMPAHLMVPAERYGLVTQRLIQSILSDGAKVVLAPMPRMLLTDKNIYKKGKLLVDAFVHKKVGIYTITELEKIQEQVTFGDAAGPGDPHFGSRIHDLITEEVFTFFQKKL